MFELFSALNLDVVAHDPVVVDDEGVRDGRSILGLHVPDSLREQLVRQQPHLKT